MWLVELCKVSPVALMICIGASAHGAASVQHVQRVGDAERAYERFEWEIELSADYTNPYDAADVALDARIVTPGGKEVTAPGFYLEPYTLELVDGAEQIKPAGKGAWRVRYRPSEPGEYRFHLTLSDGSSYDVTELQTFIVSPGVGRGAIRISRENPRAFAYDDGSAYVPMGLNICTPPGSQKDGPPTRVFEYDKWLDQMQRHGMNFGRLWLAPTYNLLCLWREPGRVDQQGAARIDHIIDLAERSDVAMMMCIEVHLNLKADRYFWKTNPMNAANGGPLKKPVEFWTDAEARREYKNRLRYLVARWGHSPAVFAWEFWNEADLTDGYNQQRAAVRQWHAEMGDYLLRVDPYDRLVTTSVSGGRGPTETVDTLPQIDVAQTHLYGSDNVTQTVGNISTWRPMDRGVVKPHIFGEFGHRLDLGIAARDNTGVGVKNALWTGVLSETPATPMFWWWSGYIDENNLWPLWGPVSAFMTNVPVAAGVPRKLDAFDLRFVDSPSTPQPVPLHVMGTWVLWHDGVPNQPMTIKVEPDGRTRGAERLSHMLHGTGNHPKWHNPMTFEVNYRQAGRFTVHVERVSPAGDSVLQVFVDNRLALEQPLPAQPKQVKGEPAPEPQTFTIDVPMGEHSIRVVNIGHDWLRASYELTGPVLSDRPWVDVRGLVLDHAEPGEAAVAGWLHNRQWTWPRVINGESVEPLPAMALTLEGLPDGAYQPQWWNTSAGTHKTGETLTVRDGRLDLPIPAFDTDTAFKLIRQ